jgi:hypothetical protein
MIKMNFQSHFSLKQFQALAELFNNSRVFQPEVEAKTMADFLQTESPINRAQCPAVRFHYE